VIIGSSIRRKLPPPLQRLFPGCALWCTGSAGQIGVGGLVWSNHAGASSSLDGHVADRHAPVHVEAPDGVAAIFDDVAGATADSDLADDAENQVLGGYARMQLARYVERQRAWLTLQQALRSHDMAYLGSAYAEGEGAERTVCAGVAVSAHDRFARLRDTELRPDDVHDSALCVSKSEQLDAELGAIELQLAYLLRRGVQGNGSPAEHLFSSCGCGVVHCRERQIQPSHR
jgi:hypothetical protein